MLALLQLLTAADSAPIRVNQVGYRPDLPKVAVVCALGPLTADRRPTSFTVVDSSGRVVLRGKGAKDRPFAACAETWRLDFSRLTTAGTYRIRAGPSVSPPVRVGKDVYAALPATILAYMRQQRSGWNPFLRDSAHTLDGIVVDHPTRTGERIDVVGGWADAADYLQYVATSATATFHLLQAYRDHPSAFGDSVDARGASGANGVPDVLDEARHGLAWLLRMFPDDSTMFNQLGDDRDHSYFDLITTDSSDYGWGKGRERPVYPCTGKPQGLFAAQNRATGYASTAGKYAAAFALGAQLLRDRDGALADTLAAKARAAYTLGQRYPGACQTAPGRAPYFYEEDDWADDMELAAASLFTLGRDEQWLASEALPAARRAGVKPWMGADTARHYQWYPWHDVGHVELARIAQGRARAEVIALLRSGIERVVRRGDRNGFRVGIPFIWCSNDLMASFATQARQYRDLTGDRRFLAHEMAALDWLFGANPWGTSMVIGVPADGVYPRDPHTQYPDSLEHGLAGGLIDGPVYRSIFQSLKGIRLLQPDEYAPFNTGFVVYHDDLGDYSTNEHIMDGSANLLWLVSALAARD
jgi:endoglucanase